MKEAAAVEAVRIQEAAAVAGLGAAAAAEAATAAAEEKAEVARKAAALAQQAAEEEREQRIEHAQQMAFKRMSRGKLARAWTTWAGPVLEERRAQRLLRVVQGRVRRPRVAACLSHWKESFEKAAAEDFRAKAAAEIQAVKEAAAIALAQAKDQAAQEEAAALMLVQAKVQAAEEALTAAREAAAVDALAAPNATESTVSQADAALEQRSALSALRRGGAGPSAPSEFLALLPSKTSIQLLDDSTRRLVGVERNAKEAVRVAAQQAGAFPKGLMSHIPKSLSFPRAPGPGSGK